jgi:hypothetical protein
LKPKTGLILSGVVMSVEEPVNKSGLAKSPPHKPYSMNFRRFQVFANKVLYDCQDQRNDEKDPTGLVVLRPGTELFPVIEEGQQISVSVIGFDYLKNEVSQYNVDTSAL